MSDTHETASLFAAVAILGLCTPGMSGDRVDAPPLIASPSWTEGKSPRFVRDEVAWVVQFWRDIPTRSSANWYDPPRPLEVAVVRRARSYYRSVTYVDYLDDQEVLNPKLPSRDTLTVRYRVRLTAPECHAGVILYLRAMPDLLLGSHPNGTTEADIQREKIGSGWVALTNEGEDWVRRKGVGQQLFANAERLALPNPFQGGEERVAAAYQPPHKVMGLVERSLATVVEKESDRPIIGVSDLSRAVLATTVQEVARRTAEPESVVAAFVCQLARDTWRHARWGVTTPDVEEMASGAVWRHGGLIGFVLLFEGDLASKGSPSPAAWEAFHQAEKEEIPMERAEAIVDSLAQAYPDDPTLQGFVPGITGFIRRLVERRGHTSLGSAARGTVQ